MSVFDDPENGTYRPAAPSLEDVREAGERGLLKYGYVEGDGLEFDTGDPAQCVWVSMDEDAARDISPRDAAGAFHETLAGFLADDPDTYGDEVAFWGLWIREELEKVRR